MMLRENWPESGLIGHIGREFNKIARLLNGMQGLNGVQIFKPPTGIQVYGGTATSENNAPWAFVSIEDKVASISGGRIIHAENEPVIVGQNLVGISNGLSYVVLEYNYANKSGLIYDTTFGAYPVSEKPHIFRCALHTFERTGDEIEYIQPNQSSDIIVPGWS